MNNIPNEINRNIWSFLFPINEINNKKINNKQLGTSVNNIFKLLYCEKCGEILDVHRCIYCNKIKFNKCECCNYTSINWDICCIEDYNDNLL